LVIKNSVGGSVQRHFPIEMMNEHVAMLAAC
jgi:hypothetical protein